MDSQLVQIAATLAQELTLQLRQVASTLALFAEGNTLPFVARYRKEATGGLDETQLRAIQERSEYLRELAERRAAIRKSIEEQGKMTPELGSRLDAVTTKQALEDLYLPFKPKRRTRAMIARERGLEPLADLILAQSLTERPELAASGYVDSEKGVEDIEAALAGARDIVAEKVAEEAVVRAYVRDVFAHEGIVVSKVRSDKVTGPTKFEQYYDFKERVKTIPSHRYLAIRRGEKEDILNFSIEVE